MSEGSTTPEQRNPEPHVTQRNASASFPVAKVFAVVFVAALIGAYGGVTLGGFTATGNLIGSNPSGNVPVGNNQAGVPPTTPPSDCIGPDCFKQYASDLGLDREKFDSCLDSSQKAAEVGDDLNEGSAAGISGTPGFIINGQRVVGAQQFSAFQAVIEQELQNPTPLGVSVGNDPVKGDANAPVTIVEFSDFQCPFCERFFTQTLPSIEENYVKTGKVKFVYKNFPLSFHAQAQKAAEASECAYEQGKFWEMHDLLFERTGEWTQ